ncbi:MAG: L-aspartate oxidase [Thermomonas sp.]
MAHAGPVIVVGSGLAGLCTALAAAPRPVLLLSRGQHANGSASMLAQGGIAAAMDPDDTIEAHVADTLRAGAGYNDLHCVQLLAAAAPASIHWLQAQGAVFDQDGDTLQLGREGGHGVARIVHAGGDATGLRVTTALVAAVAAATHVEWRSDVEVDGLVLRGGRIAGVTVDSGGRSETLPGSDVVLATGGIGALFPSTTNPPGANGAGLALAFAAGAALRDLEFVQFHPTALDVGAGSLPLVTEALRGAGARLRDGIGRLVMANAHPLGDLAPRDIVARRVCQARRETGAVTLDARGLDIDWARAFPTVLAACLQHGIDPRSMPIPVTASAHFHMGGVHADDIGRTSIPGLHAVGEVACNGVHGANRLASNSLLECVVFGRRLGAHLGKQPAAWSHASNGGAAALELVMRGPGLDHEAMQLLRDTMGQAAGPIRTEQGLREASETLAPLAGRGWQARLAQELLACAYRRKQSLGAHWRADAALTPSSASIAVA